MIRRMRIWAASALLGLTTVAATAPAQPAQAASASEINAKADLAYTQLLRESAAARALADKAVAVLIFPDIVKGGFGLGGQYGEGVLRRQGMPDGFFNIAAASFGFQIGAQSYSQVLFFMTEDSLAYLDKAKGFEIGADANVAVVDKGVAADVTSATLVDPIVAFPFGQKGLMAGVTVEGSKITRINP